MIPCLKHCLPKLPSLILPSHSFYYFDPLFYIWRFFNILLCFHHQSKHDFFWNLIIKESIRLEFVVTLIIAKSLRFESLKFFHQWDSVFFLLIWISCNCLFLLVNCIRIVKVKVRWCQVGKRKGSCRGLRHVFNNFIIINHCYALSYYWSNFKGWKNFI